MSSMPIFQLHGPRMFLMEDRLRTGEKALKILKHFFKKLSLNFGRHLVEDHLIHMHRKFVVCNFSIRHEISYIRWRAPRFSIEIADKLDASFHMDICVREFSVAIEFK